MFEETIALAPFTSLGIGGSTRFFTAPATLEATQAALAEAQRRSLPVFVLGGGSNLVIADQGWPGLTLTPRLTHQNELSVGAGLDWNVFVDRCVAQGWGGIECLAGIPGTVGATPIQNVGAYGQEVGEVIETVVALDRQSLTLRTFPHNECRFGYRTSRFNTDELGRWLIVEVRFRLREAPTPTLKYRDLIEHFGPGATPSLAEVARAVRQIRASKGMVLSPSDPDSRSAGSFFKNPILSEAQLPEGAPRYPQADGAVKTSAAWLIQNAGFTRGQTLAGGIGLSSKHILALVNQGGATASDVVEAAKRVQERVHQSWGILLHPEPIFVGFPESATLPESATVISTS